MSNEPKIGYFDESPGNQSMGRLMTFFFGCAAIGFGVGGFISPVNAAYATNCFQFFGALCVGNKLGGKGIEAYEKVAKPEEKP